MAAAACSGLQPQKLPQQARQQQQQQRVARAGTPTNSISSSHSRGARSRDEISGAHRAVRVVCFAHGSYVPHWMGRVLNGILSPLGSTYDIQKQQHARQQQLQQGMAGAGTRPKSCTSGGIGGGASSCEVKSAGRTGP